MGCANNVFEIDFSSNRTNSKSYNSDNFTPLSKSIYIHFIFHYVNI